MAWSMVRILVRSAQPRLRQLTVQYQIPFLLKKHSAILISVHLDAAILSVVGALLPVPTVIVAL